MTEVHHADDVVRAQNALHEEHATLRHLLGELKQTDDVARVGAVLEELQPLLQAHFEREELPGGLYERLGLHGEQYAREVRLLVDDHFRFVSKVQSLKRAIGSINRSNESVVAEARALVEGLQRHEALEHDLAARVQRYLP